MAVSRRSAWWSGVGQGDPRNVVLFHVDLGGHSAWVERIEATESRKVVYDKRKEIATELQSRLKAINFDCHHWAGDGGLFARELRSSNDADTVCSAADVTFEAFDVWRRSDDSLSRLHIRVVATAVLGLSVDRDPAFWCATSMNGFLKHERDLGHPDSFVITNDLRTQMSPKTFQNRFPKSSTVAVGKGSNLRLVTVWEDIHHPTQRLPPDENLRQWLQASGFAASPSSPFFSVGDSLLLDVADQPTGYSRIVLLPAESRDVGDGILEPDHKPLQDRIDQLTRENVTGKKLSVASFRGELTDEPFVRLKANVTEYAELRAFHDLMERDSERRAKYLEIARTVTSAGVNLPTTLSNHSIVIFTTPDDKRFLLLCHRRKGKRPGGYCDNVWSPSFEEQFNPVAHERNRRPYPADDTIERSILRGVTEEILGPNFHRPFELRVHAFQLETWVVNFGFIGAVILSGITFADLVACWRTAVDRTEHDALAAVSLDPSTIRQCLKSPTLPAALWTAAPKAQDAPLDAGDHRWHPTASARLALARWYAETAA